MALAGAGIAQLNEFQIRNALQQKQLVKILEDWNIHASEEFHAVWISMISMFLIAYVHSWIFGRACLYKLV